MNRYFLALFLMLFAGLSYASESPPSPPLQKGGDKGVWVEAEGEAYLGEIDTPKEVKERAKRDAEVKAIDKAVGTFIKSHTVVSNSQLADDLIYASVRGKIEKVEVLKEGWD